MSGAQAYRISGPHRRPAGKMAIHPMDSRDGFKGRASQLADQFGGAYSHTVGGYVVGPKTAADFALLFEQGFNGGIRWRYDRAPKFTHPDHPGDMTKGEALKLARKMRAAKIEAGLS